MTKKRDRPRIAIGVCILAGVVIVYVLSLFGVHFLQRSEGPLPPLDLSQGGGDATIVQLRLEELKPVANRLSVNVLVYPGVAQYDNRFDVLANDVAVRLYPTSDLGDLHYPKGKAPAQLSTTVEAHGDPGNWPFDSYRTEPISADAFVGSGDNLKKVPARVEVTGALDGWQITVDRVRDPRRCRRNGAATTATSSSR
ncbi:putative transmembrane protein [Mycobacterium avium subsp. avium 2285 (R)]|nr:putative transmembrane protein [Mycobacterium avium subsp. avium 2285 (R)]